jgi:D-alanyl-D-alanine dipeptidase
MNLRQLQTALFALLLSLTLCSCCCTKPAPVAAESPDPDELVNVEELIPGIQLDIRYATTNNFTGQILYPVAKCYLRRQAAEQLKLVQEELRGMGLALKIFDGYRPLSVQKKMWAIYPNPGFVADPAKGSKHNRGAAVDLTLIRLDGTELAMPTPYDDFTEKAASRYMNLPDEVLKNRALLERVMREHDFRELNTEWWHFDFRNSRKYDIMDIDYSQLH